MRKEKPLDWDDSPCFFHSFYSACVYVCFPGICLFVYDWTESCIYKDAVRFSQEQNQMFLLKNSILLSGSCGISIDFSEETDNYASPFPLKHCQKPPQPQT